MRVLGEQEWRARRAAHQERVELWTGPHRRRQRAGQKHPVMDFLFTYYSHKPSLLERWQPGLGVALAGGEEFLERRGYLPTPGGVALDPAVLTAKRRDTARFVHGLLTAVRSRRPHLGCFGLHEWAMLYRTSPTDVRHEAWPLRLGHAGTDEVVESMPIKCSHHDAFRFFTEPARPLNALQPTRAEQTALEQPGCLHNNMDMFKWAYKLDPLVPSELVADCFELAVEIREADMRASPYDLSELGYEPIAVETAEGRAEYVRRQRDFADRAAPLRARLIQACEDLLAVEPQAAS
ncbi:3-methyladenine DNA glycosylase [Saccharopolyspora sp. NFXS83]|uniref:3-methyladenine DNA glycosylase n=1 Tax=Saccharopolyspora sp. NFXS83 TaxID=2993560 RepID=UPI00224A698A|nr:3-methyladenine DNA glycosylase [Saccharopolyspora sp. NFXS83]MCX2733127.1 3-methyladenine DNA glycosylase [Saccharopolyspora sp. NFXS83]